MVFRLFSISRSPRRVRMINAISMFLVFLMLFMYTNPYFMTSADADWKEPVMVVGGGIAAAVTIAGVITTIPIWLTVTGAVAGGVAAGTAIWEWVDDDCDDCDGSGCKKCDPPDDDDCDDCDGSGCDNAYPYLLEGLTMNIWIGGIHSLGIFRECTQRIQIKVLVQGTHTNLCFSQMNRTTI